MQTAFRASSGRSARGVHWGGQVPTWAKHLCAVCAAASSSGEHLRWFCGHLGLAETSGPSRRLHLAQLVLEGRQEMVGHVPAVQPHCRFSGRPAHCLHAGIGISCGSFASLPWRSQRNTKLFVVECSAVLSLPLPLFEQDVLF